MSSSDGVFEAVRRGYEALGSASDNEIRDYFASIDPDAMGGHISNVKGILFEQEYFTKLCEAGISAELFEATNHPISDITIFDDAGIGSEFQLKATDSVAYVNSTLAEHPDIPIVVTSEVAAHVDSELVIDSGISEAALEEAVSQTLTEDFVNPVSPVSVISWLFGLPF